MASRRQHPFRPVSFGAILTAVLVLGSVGCTSDEIALARMRTPGMSASITPRYGETWAGVVVLTKPHAIYRADVSYIEPTVTHSCSHASAEATWVGIGGSTPNAALAQVGTTWGFQPSGLADHEAYFQLVGVSSAGGTTTPPEKFPRPLVVRPGEHVRAIVVFEQSTPLTRWKGGRYQFTVSAARQNRTVRITRGFPQSQNEAGYYSGNSAEAVVEAPTVVGSTGVGGLVEELPNFGSVPFWGFDINHYVTVNNYFNGRREWSGPLRGPPTAVAGSFARGAFTDYYRKCT